MPILLAPARWAALRGADPIIKALDEHARLTDDLEAAKELAEEDSSLAAEAAELEARLGQVTERLTRLLAPRDPNDSSDALMEIKSGEGGEESACSPLTCSRCIRATPRAAGRSRFSMLRKPISAATSQ